MKYAVMVCLDGKDDWLYITEDTGKCDFDLQPVLFDTEDEADSFATAWRLSGAEKSVKVIEYRD